MSVKLSSSAAWQRNVPEQPQPPPNSQHEPDWFEAVDALKLLNMMTRKVRTGPPARPLPR